MCLYATGAQCRQEKMHISVNLHEGINKINLKYDTCQLPSLLLLLSLHEPVASQTTCFDMNGVAYDLPSSTA